MSQQNELAKDPVKHERIVAPWLKKTAPAMYFYGPTGVGKTYAIKQLIEFKLSDGTRPYAPVLYIDADMSHETVGAAVDIPELCILRSFDGRYDEMLSWLFKELMRAEHVKCGSIVIEGFNSVFKSMLAPAIRELSQAKGQDLWGAHNEPSQRIDTAFEAVKELKVNRNAAGNGVPIVGSLNVREIDKVQGDSKSGKMLVPDFSPNRTRAAMRTCDAFIELQREASSVMLCQRDSHNKFRKLRNPEVAELVDAAHNLTIPGLLRMWAFSKARGRKKLTAELLDAANAAATPTANPETDKDTPS